jgi:hypothetical protein
MDWSKMKRIKRKYKVKSKVEIKGENVRLISPEWAQRPTGPLWPAPWSGAPNPLWLVGPCRQRYKERWGPAARSTRFTAFAVRPTDIPIRSRVSAEPTGSSTAATAHPLHPSPPPCRRPTVQPPREKVTICVLSIPLHLSQYTVKSFTEIVVPALDLP